MSGADVAPEPVEVPAAVAFADLSGYTALTDSHGDRTALAVADRLRRLAEEAASPEVRIVKTIGDAVMLTCDDPATLLAAALRLVAYVGAEPRYPAVSVGIDAGPVLVRDGDLFGNTVNVAARAAGRAEPGTIVVTEPVAAVAETTACDPVRPLGPVRLRNLVDPVPLFAIEPCETAASEDIDPVCRMRVGPEQVHARRHRAGRDWVFCSAACIERFDAAPERFVPEERQDSAD